LSDAFSADPGPESAELGLFYGRLADAEGRHWELFRDLALTTAPVAAVERRLAEMAQAEGAIVASRPLEPRMH
jgi:tRNA isopentenyl-2-thiomethyl-A-37 hydroxylase MiaE